MPTFAARIPPQLLQSLRRLEDHQVPIAETCRRLGREAERLQLTRPSYERVRVLVHELRRDGSAAAPSESPEPLAARTLWIRHRQGDSRLLALLQRHRARPAQL